MKADDKPWSYGYSPEHRNIVIHNVRGETLMVVVRGFSSRVLAKNIVTLVNQSAARVYRAELDKAKLVRKRGRPPGSGKGHGPLGPRLPVAKS